MMDRKLRAQIIEMLEDVKQGIARIEASQEAVMLEECIAALQSIADICREQLSVERYTVYGEVFDGMLAAIAGGGAEQLSGEEMKKAAGLSKELIDFVIQELQHEKEVKKEIVFLPYKASMWDSLESIWRAAAADTEHCNTYVVAIPYADRNPDMTAKEWHCEAGLFPKDVPIIDYREIDLAKLHPDIIYIHYPYDNQNAATSVDSEYYSFNLRKYTDLLVYVPYFIVGRRWPESHVALSCYPYVDKIVVQKDHMQIAPMSNSSMQETTTEFLEDYISADKLVTLGTPKIDRVFYCEKHKKIPASWQEFIGQKKAVLYNISISGMLGQGERFLHKMEYVFSCFAKRRDVALVWRPHPLMEAAIESVVPALSDKYKRLKQRFIDEKIGILDDTPDVDMAIAAVDAYIGESSSSVVQLFGFAGKSIFFTDEILLWKEPTEEEKMSVVFGYSLADPDDFWFIAEGYNTFCRMDKISGHITPLLSFGDHPYNGGMYTGFVREEDVFYFAPGSAECICIYDSKADKAKYIPFEQPLQYGNFAGAVSYKQYIFFIPSRYPAILRYDKETGECRKFDQCLEEILKCRQGIHEELLAASVVRGSKLILPCIQANKVLEFDMETSAYRVYAIGAEDTDCMSIIAENEDVYWLFPWKTKKIRRWNYRTGSCEIIDRYPDDFQCGVDWFNLQDSFMFAGVVPAEDSVWLFPAYGNMVLRLCYADQSIEKVNFGLPYSFDDRKSNFYMQQVNFFGAVRSGAHEIAALSSYDRSLVLLDTEKLQIRLQTCRLDAKDAARISTPIAQAFDRVGKDMPYAVTENVVGRSINQYIDYVKNGIHDKRAQQEAYRTIANHADGTCGQRIHDCMMEQAGL